MDDKWTARFWSLARFVSAWSKDPAARVGAAVVTERGGAVALGYNGLPSGVEDRAERLTDVEIKLDMIVHAEQNALLIAGPLAAGAHLYVYGKPVCSRCAGLIIQSGISRVVCTDPDSVPTDSKWHLTGKRAIEMMREAGVSIVYRDDGEESTQRGG